MLELIEERSQSLAWRVYTRANHFSDLPALDFQGTTITYGELYRKASSIAQTIMDLDNPNPFVAVMADKSLTCYAGIIGILMAGKAYLPLNPAFPPSRNLYMLRTARISVVLAGDHSDDELDLLLDQYDPEVFIIFPEEMENLHDRKMLPRIVSPSDPAYLLFTSGTTGNPKGVPVTHGNVSSYLESMLNRYHFDQNDRFTQLFDLTFDLSVHDMFLAWSAGACLLVQPDNSSFAMSRFIREQQPTVWFSVPSLVHLMDRMRLLRPGAFPSIRHSFFCGEALQEKTAAMWKSAAGQSRITNLYGPTEATIAISAYDLPDQTGLWKSSLGIVSIGQLLGDHVFMIDRKVASDATGELCLAGDQVVKGYFASQEADLQSFFVDEVSGIKYYRTGDQVKMDEEGDLYFCGRKDSEIKISGYRVNLKEIENTISAYERVNQSVVLFEEDKLLAFVLPAEGWTGEKELDAFCRDRLPWYMVPSEYMLLDALPLNVNGKTDKAQLIQKYYEGK